MQLHGGPAGLCRAAMPALPVACCLGKVRKCVQGKTLNAPFIPAPPATLLQVRQTELPRLLGSRWQQAQRP